MSTSDFDRKYLENECRHRQADNGVINRNSSRVVQRNGEHSSTNNDN